jgi:aspartate/methionine/tyrosine aminotransferase
MEIVAEGVGKFDGYTQFIGSESCRQAIAEFYNKIEPVKVDKNDVFLTCGGSLALWLSIAVLCDPGDNFLFPEAGFPLSNTIAKSLGI